MMFKKIILMVLAVGVVLTNNVFAAETKIKVNDLEITINRSMSDEFERYDAQANDSLEEMTFEFSPQNNFSIKRTDEVAWSISGKYNGEEFNTDSSKMAKVEISSGTIEIGNLSDNGATIIISRGLSDALFNRIFENHSPFTFNAESVAGKQINVKRDPAEDSDAYTFSSNQELNNAKVSDGDHNFEISKNENGSFNISGKYKDISIDKKNVSIPYGSNIVLEYNGMKLGVLFPSNREITITPDSAIIERIAEELLEEKNKVTQIDVPSNGELDISSNPNVTDITVPSSVADPKIIFSSSTEAQINQELTIDSQNTGMKIVFPQNVKITGLEEGTMNLPKKASVSIPEKSGIATNVLLAIEVGSSGAINFDKPVKLVFPGMAGKKIGFEKSGVFKEITNNCPSEFTPNECKRDSGSDLLVFTNHFTKFAVYSESAISTGGGGGEATIYLDISNINIDAKNNEATILFNTSKSTSAILKYGTQENVYTNEIKEDEFKTSHSFNLTNLSNEKYYYRIEVKDKDGSSANYSGSFALNASQAQGATEANNNIETSTKVKELTTYNYNGVITTKPLNEMNREELFRLFLILLLKSLLAQRGITL